MQILQLTPQHAPEYRALRMRALGEYPEAFTSSHDEEQKKGADWYVARLSDPDQCFWGAFDRAVLVGMVGLERRKRQRERHKATVVGMFVQQDYAGRGLGHALFDRVLSEARAMGIELLVLTVTEGNAQARRLYESVGFQTFGIEPHAVKVDGVAFGKEHMYLILPPHVPL